MTTETPRPPCPICGSPRGILVRNRTPTFEKLAETCGNRTCAAKLRAQRMGPAHYAKLSRLGHQARLPTRSDDYNAGYHAGHKAGRLSGYRQAKEEMEMRRCQVNPEPDITAKGAANGVASAVRSRSTTSVGSA